MSEFENPGRRFAERAQECENAGRYSEAGDLYSFASYAALADSEFTKMTTLAAGIYWLLNAVLCYRIGAASERARNRADQGVLIAEDLRLGPFTGKALRGLEDEADAMAGLTYEYAGDFQLLVGDSSVEVSYDRAEEFYHRCGLHHAWCSEAEFDVPFRFFVDVVERAGCSYDTELLDRATTSSLIARLRFKASELPDAVETVVDRGEL